MVASSRPKKKKPSTPPSASTIDKVFEHLLRLYTRRRNWDMVSNLFDDYGRILEDRELLS